jgi:hypothetical protein
MMPDSSLGVAVAHADTRRPGQRQEDRQLSRPQRLRSENLIADEI